MVSAPSPAHPHERTRDALIDHHRPALPRCCRLPPLPHRCYHTAPAAWAHLGCSYADDVTLLLPYHTAMLILQRRCYRAAAATQLPLPHYCCSHTAAATLRLLHCTLLANATPAAAVPADDGAARAAGGLPEGPPPPPGPQGRRRGHPSPPCATARRGRPEAYPKGRPYCQKSDPAPPGIGRGSKRALTHRAGKSNRLM